MLEELSQIFNTFLTNISNNEWTNTFIALIIFVVLIIILCNMIRR